ncbi:MAG: carbohydrate kinase family protein [Patescibacteria group bacterium]
MFNKMYDIITFGSAAQDINLKSKAFKVTKDNKDFVTGEGLCLALGSKIDIEDIKFTSGGGGTNTAVAFAKQGFKTAFCGMVGKDAAGKAMVNELKKNKVDTALVQKTKEKLTNHSVVISSDGEDRTILVYRGASDLFGKDNIPWNKLKTKWIYLAPLSGLLLRPSEAPQSEGGCTPFEDIVNFAFENKIKIAVNPGNTQLSLPIEDIIRIFKKIDILILNQEEASFLTKISFQNEAEIFKKIDEICPGVAVMTKGGEGVVASDGKYLYSALPNPSRKVVDTTGAGDSFASGFISDYIRYSGDIEKAIQLGLANAEANLAEIGAKTTLLDKNSKFQWVKVVKQLCSENGLCQPK